MESNEKKVQLVKAGNIENAITLFHAPEDTERRKIRERKHYIPVRSMNLGEKMAE